MPATLSGLGGHGSDRPDHASLLAGRVDKSEQARQSEQGRVNKAEWASPRQQAFALRPNLVKFEAVCGNAGSRSQCCATLKRGFRPV